MTLSPADPTAVADSGTSPTDRATWTVRRRVPGGAEATGPLSTVAAAVHLVRGATTASVLHRDGTARPMPGSAEDDLLATASPVVALARARLDEGQVMSTFLWPLGGPHAPDGHVRVTVVTCPDGASAGIQGTVVLSPAGDLRGLTPRELEVLGLVVDGCTNQEIARTLVVAPRTVAAHLEHVLVKLDAPTRTLAAVRAEREGLLVPTVHSPCRG